MDWTVVKLTRLGWLSLYKELNIDKAHTDLLLVSDVPANYITDIKIMMIKVYHKIC